jgi:hypothetical protein
MAPTIITRVKVSATPSFNGGQPYDLASLPDVKLELNIENNKFDLWLKKAISRASDAIATYCNRHFQVETFEEEYWAYRDPYPWQLPSHFMPLQLQRWPLTATESVAGTSPPWHPPRLSVVTGGALSAQPIYAKTTYVTADGETAASLESFLLVGQGQLLSVASPPMDHLQKAIGWNCYLGASSFGETLQNAAPLPIGLPYTLPDTGLVIGAPLPSYTLVVERAREPRALVEGRDFQAEHSTAQLTRLLMDGYAGRWSGVPLIIAYRAGFKDIPEDVQDACIQLVKSRWYARARDPNVKTENVAGVYSAEYWFGTGPGGPADMPSYVADKLARFRVPVIA